MKTGDVVVLKSGGPSMTVKKVEDGLAAVVWFENYAALPHFQWGSERTGSFPVEALKVANES